MCSETSEAEGTTWEHAQLEFQNFLKIRIALLHMPIYTCKLLPKAQQSEQRHTLNKSKGQCIDIVIRMDFRKEYWFEISNTFLGKDFNCDHSKLALEACTLQSFQ